MASSSSTLTALLLAAFAALASAGNYTVTDEAWFEVEIKDMDGPGQDYRGRFVVALFGETAPMTCMNFAAITRGYKRGKENLHYKKSVVHRVVPDFVVQMGDITVGDGTGGRSIFGERFNDEDFILSHRSAGWVAMANHGPDSNGSQFYILLTKARWLDGKHVVFGKVVQGFDVVRTMGEVPADQQTAVPKRRIKIVNCGLNELDKKYDLTEDQLDSTEDL
jgi:cyclophilin family peptidyl-prolyl cis-trans isomerase